MSGSRAFMPASRSGAKEQADLEKLVGQEIQCRIIKLDTATEDVVVDRRAVSEEEEAQARAKKIRRTSGRRRGARNRAQPDRFRRVRRSGRRGRVAARRRHGMASRGKTVRRRLAGRIGRGQDSQDQPGIPPHFAGLEAARTRSLDPGRRTLSQPAIAYKAKFRAWRILAHSSS